MDSERLKTLLGSRAKDIIASGYGFKPNKQGKALCPIHSEKTPSMNWFEPGLAWKCHGCGESIDIYRYYTEFEKMTFKEALAKVAELTGQEDLERIAPKKEFALPNIVTRELSEESINYMRLRKIEKETIEAWQVKEIDRKGAKALVFQYFERSSDKNPTFVSYREPKKDGVKGGCEANTKAILWGMWHIDKEKPLVICEGQPDAMAIWQSGYRNVVSVPMGSKNLNWIDYCWDWLQDIKEIIVFPDNDDPGYSMAIEIKNRLKNVKIVEYDGGKDANEVMYRKGEEFLLSVIEKTINNLPSGLLDVSKIEFKSYAENSYNGIETGFKDYDAHIEDLKEQELTIIFGRNGEGKTTFISQVIAHCLEKRVKTFLYSGEMSNNKIQHWLYRQLVGSKIQYCRTVQTKYKEKVEVKPEIIESIKEWHKDIFYLYDKKADLAGRNLDSFFDLMQMSASRYGIKLFIIDNLMSKLEENADSLYSDQANFVQRCKDFADANFCHVILLAHPNKDKGESKKGEPNLEKTDISGSNNIANKADNIISIERNWTDDEYKSADCFICSLKDREEGQRKVFYYRFSRQTLRFYNEHTIENRQYGWEKHLKQEKKLEIPDNFTITSERNPFMDT